MSEVHSAKKIEIPLAGRTKRTPFGYSEQCHSFCGRPPPSRSL